jgi:hypothetical protein
MGNEVEITEKDTLDIAKVPGAEAIVPRRENTSHEPLLPKRGSLPNDSIASKESASETSTVEIPLISIHKSYSRSYSNETTSSAGSGTYRLNYTKVQSPTEYTNR